MTRLLSINWVVIAAGWYFVNGLLHDIFVWKAHKTGYDRDLLRLLMDGHVMLLSGAVLFVCYQMMVKGITGAAIISLLIAAFMIIYCLMIFPFLRSFVTLFISAILVFVSIKAMNGSVPALAKQ